MVIAKKDRVSMNHKRIIDDRRKQSTPFLSGQTIFGGRRRTIRREADKRKYIFFDSYDLRLFITLLLLLILSVSDAYLTLTLVKTYNATELNPIMAVYLEHGSITFFLEKFLFTSVAVFIFCVFNHFAVARVSLSLAIIIYIGIVYYELIIMSGLLR
ncbi:MAG: DUF5658 family protein [Nitrospiraceae bacterium]|nr:DUF5658 family protein [Nitrospiraceae bacterium]